MASKASASISFPPRGVAARRSKEAWLRLQERTEGPSTWELLPETKVIVTAMTVVSASSERASAFWRETPAICETFSDAKSQTLIIRAGCRAGVER